MTDLVPLILCALDDAVRAKSLAAPEDADLAALADGLTLAVDHCALASRTPIDAIAPHISDLGEGFAGVLIDGDDTDPSAVDWPMRVPIARRLADVAASLCVRGMSLRREAEALWKAASRLLGMDGVPASDADPVFYNANDTHDLTAWRTWAKASVLPGSLPKYDQITDNDLRHGVVRHIAKHADEVDALKRKHAEDDRALVEAHARELREAKEAHAKEVADLRESMPSSGRNDYANLERAVCQVLTAAGLEHMLVPGNRRPRLPECDEWKFALLAVIGKSIVVAGRTGGVEPHFSYRDAILSDCAYECTIYHGPAQGEMRVVVGGLRDGKTLDDVAAVLERMGRAPGTYSLREVKSPEGRAAISSPPEPHSYCDQLMAEVADECTVTTTNESVFGRRVAIFDVIPKRGKTLSDVYSFLMDIVPVTDRRSYSVRDASVGDIK